MRKIILVLLMVLLVFFWQACDQGIIGSNKSMLRVHYIENDSYSSDTVFDYGYRIGSFTSNRPLTLFTPSDYFEIDSGTYSLDYLDFRDVWQQVKCYDDNDNLVKYFFQIGPNKKYSLLIENITYHNQGSGAYGTVLLLEVTSLLNLRNSTDFYFGGVRVGPAHTEDSSLSDGSQTGFMDIECGFYQLETHRISGEWLPEEGEQIHVRSNTRYTVTLFGSYNEETGIIENFHYEIIVE